MVKSDREKQNEEFIAIKFTLNDQKTEIRVHHEETALSALRSRLGMTGTKEGCGIGECGVCTIIVDGKTVNSCLMLAAQLEGRIVETVEGLTRDNQLHPLQEAFLQEGAVQCGFCTPGMLMSVKALLDVNPHPSRNEITDAVSGNLCRCTGYEQIIKAVERASGEKGCIANYEKQVSLYTVNPT